MDYYQILGVTRTASQDEIKKSYRKLAAIFHPDKEGGDTDKFQELQRAYDTLSDPQKRAVYDNPQPQFNGFNQNNFNFDSIFDIFGARFTHQGQQNPFTHQAQQQRRPQIRMALWITLADVALGGKRTVSIGTPYGVTTVEIEVPIGIEDNQSVQYPELAPNGGDLIVTYRIHPNAQYERNGLHITTTKTISIWDCILGTEVTVLDLTGQKLSLHVPERTNPSSLLRLKGKGLKDRSGNHGDFFVKIQAKIPETISPELIQVIENNRTQPQN